MESGEITAEQIIASSQYNSNWSPERSRLNYHENGWTPSDDTIRQWIQVSGRKSGFSPPRLESEVRIRRLISQSDLKLVPPRCRGRNIVHSFVRVRRTLLGHQETGRHPLCINICLDFIVESDLAVQPRNNTFKQVVGETLSESPCGSTGDQNGPIVRHRNS